jgi:hypothetical protein
VENAVRSCHLSGETIRKGARLVSPFALWACVGCHLRHESCALHTREIPPV